MYDSGGSSSMNELSVAPHILELFYEAEHWKDSLRSKVPYWDERIYV